MPAACRQHSSGFWFINETQTADGVDPYNWWHGVIGPSSGSDTESGQVTFRQSFLNLKQRSLHSNRLRHLPPAIAGSGKRHNTLSVEKLSHFALTLKME